MTSMLWRKSMGGGDVLSTTALERMSPELQALYEVASEMLASGDSWSLSMTLTLFQHGYNLLEDSLPEAFEEDPFNSPCSCAEGDVTDGCRRAAYSALDKVREASRHMDIPELQPVLLHALLRAEELLAFARMETERQQRWVKHNPLEGVQGLAA